MSAGSRIKELREKIGMTQVQLADKIDVSKQTLYKYENDIITNIPSDKIEAIAKICGVTPSYIMGWEKSDFDNIYPIDLHRYPLAGEIACGKPIFADEDRESYVMAGTAIRADFCLRAKGDSMINARIHDGDIVFIRKDEELINGEIYAVAIGDEATLKRVYLDKEKNTVQLVAENPKYQPLVYIGDELNTIHILGKAIAFQSDIR